MSSSSPRHLLRPAERREGRFENPVPTPKNGFGTLLTALPRLLTSRHRTPRGPIGPFTTDPTLYQRLPANGLRVTWFGHSSLLLEIDGVRVLIDPVWARRASPFKHFGPKRFFAPTLPLQTLPVPDVVLLTHDHFDHLGADTVSTLAAFPHWKTVRWVTALEVGKTLRELGVAPEQLQELNWTESLCVTCPLGEPLTLTCMPARHFSGRHLRERFTTLWSSWVLEGAKHRVYLGADSGQWPGFAEIAAQYDGFDLIMLEIGAFDPAWAHLHLGPDGAGQAFTAMLAAAQPAAHAAAQPRLELLMPIHWGLFSLAPHPWTQPIVRLRELAGAAGWKLWSPRPGEPTAVTGELMDLWWQQEPIRRRGRRAARRKQKV